MNTGDGLGCRPLQKSAWLGVKDAAKKIVGRCVSNIELDSRIETSEFDEISFAKLSRLLWRLCGHCLFQQFANRPYPFDAKLRGPILWSDAAAFENNVRRLNLCRPTIFVAREDKAFAVVESSIGKLEEIF